MALAGSIIIGLVGYANKVSNKENMLKMVIIMVIFYIVGCFIRNTITGILDENRKKAEKQEKRELEEKRQKEELERKQNGNKKESKLDLVADDELDLNGSDGDFDTLPVAEFIKNELNK
jgi:phosphate/sulfate permease